jgi:hypothetical protein
MAVLDEVTAGDTVKAADINQFKDAMEGASGSEVTWVLKETSGQDMVLKLGGNASSRKLSIQDSDGNEIFKIDGDGKITLSKELVLLAIATPVATTAGALEYDSTKKLISYANGTDRRLLGPQAIQTDVLLGLN